MRHEQFRFVGFINGMLLVALGAAMLFPLLVDLAAGSSDWQVFAVSSGLTLLVGGSMALA